MKTPKLKSSLALCLGLMLIFPLMGGCEKNEPESCNVTAVAGQENNIIGTWKLVKGETVFYELRTEDYFCNNILYKFNPDGKLTITSDLTNHIGHDAGEYDFNYTLSSSDEEPEEYYTLKINQLNWHCIVQASNMTLNNAPLDGPILYLIRIE